MNAMMYPSGGVAQPGQQAFMVCIPIGPFVSPGGAQGGGNAEGWNMQMASGLQGHQPLPQQQLTDAAAWSNSDGAAASGGHPQMAPYWAPSQQAQASGASYGEKGVGQQPNAQGQPTHWFRGDGGSGTQEAAEPSKFNAYAKPFTPVGQAAAPMQFMPIPATQGPSHGQAHDRSTTSLHEAHSADTAAAGSSATTMASNAVPKKKKIVNQALGGGASATAQGALEDGSGMGGPTAGTLQSARASAREKDNSWTSTIRALNLEPKQMSQHHHRNSQGGRWSPMESHQALAPEEEASRTEGESAVPSAVSEEQTPECTPERPWPPPPPPKTKSSQRSAVPPPPPPPKARRSYAEGVSQRVPLCQAYSDPNLRTQTVSYVQPAAAPAATASRGTSEHQSRPPLPPQAKPLTQRPPGPPAAPEAASAGPSSSSDGYWVARKQFGGDRRPAPPPVPGGMPDSGPSDVAAVHQERQRALHDERYAQNESAKWLDGRE